MFTIGAKGRCVCAIVAHPHLPLVITIDRVDIIHHRVRVWDLETRTCLRVCKKHNHMSDNSCLAIDPAGRLAAVTVGRTVQIWELDSGLCVRTLESPMMPCYMNAVVWDPTSSYVASGGAFEVGIWSIASGTLQSLATTSLEKSVHCLVSHPTESLLASGSDCAVGVQRWPTGEGVHLLHGHTERVTSLAASTKWLVSGSSDNTTRIWSWATGECARVLHFARELDYSSLAWRGSTLAIHDAMVHVWDTSAEDPRDWTCTDTLKSKSRGGRGVAVVEGGFVACPAPDTFDLVAVYKNR